MSFVIFYSPYLVMLPYGIRLQPVDVGCVIGPDIEASIFKWSPGSVVGFYLGNRENF
jgi:hypothetical protein